jgi:uncharacterized phage-like protein YoqJ
MATACFTGHRKLNGAYYNAANPSAEWHTLRQYMDKILTEMCKDPYNIDTYISGLAIGVDLLGIQSAALVRCFIKNHVKLIGAMPFASQASRWPEATRQHWQGVYDLCNEVVIVSEGEYHPSKMQIRNQWMVDHADYVIAVWNGQKSGGTWNCIKYAIKQGKSILTVKLTGSEWDCGWIVSEE